MHNFDMKQPNFKVFENVNCKAIGSDVFSSGPTKLVILNDAERAVKRIIKAKVYHQGVKREGFEASGVEQSSCDARVWALPRDKTRWRILKCIIKGVVSKSYLHEGQPRSTRDEFLANIYFIFMTRRSDCF